MNQVLSSIVTALDLGAKVSRLVQSRLSIDSISKQDRSPVTVADLAVQAVITLHLRELDDRFMIVAEEDLQQVAGPQGLDVLREVTELVDGVRPGTTSSMVEGALGDRVLDPPSTGSYWILDPIDGTKGFLRKQQYAIALARYEAGSVVAGGLGCPNLTVEDSVGVLCLAGRGSGAWRRLGEQGELEPISASQIRSPSQLTLCESVESGHSSHAWSANIAEALKVGNQPVRMDSQCKYAAVAMGLADVYLRLPVRMGYEEKVWDHAAGVIVVEEAGGVVTDIHGEPLHFDRGHTLSANQGVVVSNGHSHGAVLDAIRRTAP
jgi:3'(2'), 5'-bisphosphate nucleotidase